MGLETQPSLFDIHLIFIQISYSCNVQLSITQTNTVYFTEIPEDLYVAITVNIGFTLMQFCSGSKGETDPDVS